MKKSIVAVLLGTMALAMVACGTTDGKTETSGSTEVSTETEAETEGTELTETEGTEAEGTELTGTEGTETEGTETEGTEGTEGTEAEVEFNFAEANAIGILEEIYNRAEGIDAGLKSALTKKEGFEMAEITAEMAEMHLGSADITFDNAVISVPMMSSVAYQVVVLQVPEGGDVEATKQALLDNADPMKWVCVQPEAVEAVAIGNTILFMMTEQANVDAFTTAFQGLAE